MDRRKSTPAIRGSPQTAGQIRIDLHCHSVYSGDSALTLETILCRGKELGLQGVAVTDHDRLLPEGVIRRYRHPGSHILLIPGCEVTTLGGHLLVFGMDTVPPTRRPLAETIHHVRDRGGIPILAHPFRVNDGVGERKIAAFPDVLFEGMNGRSWMRYNLRALEKGYAAGRSMTGGSDAHDRAGLGRAWTVITGSGSCGGPGADDPTEGQIPDPTEILTLDRVMEALEKGKVEPGGTGLSTGGLVWSKAAGTLRWARRLTGRKWGNGLDRSGGGQDRENRAGGGQTETDRMGRDDGTGEDRTGKDRTGTGRTGEDHTGGEPDRGDPTAATEERG